ncbi:hypothetical protein scyTo_0026284, partial [Scyliorhinus torazame]|nr:hypothetical protein [Scyliorhinus torazame]
LSDGDSVTQRESSLTQTEREDVTLSCTYTDDALYLFWYRQYPDREPEFAVRRHTGGGAELKADFAQDRFSDTVQQSDKLYRLTISELRLLLCRVSQ